MCRRDALYNVLTPEVHTKRKSYEEREGDRERASYRERASGISYYSL